MICTVVGFHDITNETTSWMVYADSAQEAVKFVYRLERMDWQFVAAFAGRVDVCGRWQDLPEDRYRILRSEMHLSGFTVVSFDRIYDEALCISGRAMHWLLSIRLFFWRHKTKRITPHFTACLAGLQKPILTWQQLLRQEMCRV